MGISDERREPWSLSVGASRASYEDATGTRRGGHRAFRVLAVPVLIGAILVVGWLLVATAVMPRFSPAEPVVKNGVAAVMVCGKKQGMAGMVAAMKYVPEPGTGTWWPEQQGNCTVWYHHQPSSEQRHNRHERAQDERAQREH